MEWIEHHGEGALKAGWGPWCGPSCILYVAEEQCTKSGAFGVRQQVHCKTVKDNGYHSTEPCTRWPRELNVFPKRTALLVLSLNVVTIFNEQN